MRVVSAIQPSGVVHIGNYIGAIQNWIKMQEKGHDCVYFIANQHAITLPKKSKDVEKATLQMAAMLLATGIDPQKSILFVQSDVPAHVKFLWILNCLTPIGWMEGMIQFKEKSRQNPQGASVGLFDYPILQAADILLYKADIVPVGRDQEQHLELTRKLARKFNSTYKEIFKEPKTLNTSIPKILGLDGKSKMSKSLNNYISLNETEKSLWEKLAPATTDISRIKKSDPGNPENCNIFTIHKCFSHQEDVDWVKYGCKNATIGCIDCKKKLAKNLLIFISPIKEKYEKLIKKPDDIRDILKYGAQRANEIANKTIEEIYELIGFKY